MSLQVPSLQFSQLPNLKSESNVVCIPIYRIYTFFDIFCYNFHFVLVTGNHPITAHVAVPVIKILSCSHSPTSPSISVSKGRRILGVRARSHEPQAYHRHICLSDRSCASHLFDFSTRRILPVSGGRAQCRLRLWQTHVGMATQYRYKVYHIPDAIRVRVLDPTCHRFGCN